MRLHCDPAAAIVGLVLLSGCVDAQRESTLLAPGSQAPALEAAGWLNGPAPTPSELKGRVVVVDVWAWW